MRGLISGTRTRRSPATPWRADSGCWAPIHSFSPAPTNTDRRSSERRKQRAKPRSSTPTRSRPNSVTCGSGWAFPTMTTSGLRRNVTRSALRNCSAAFATTATSIKALTLGNTASQTRCMWMGRNPEIRARIAAVLPRRSTKKITSSSFRHSRTSCWRLMPIRTSFGRKPAAMK